MKDMYSWHRDQKDFERFYEIVKQAYLRVYSRCGLTAKVTEASGGSFSKKISYEFMVLTDAGEDDILYCPSCEYCVNVEIAKTQEGDACPKCTKGKLMNARASEVGNVFDLGQKYCKDFNFKVRDEFGELFYPTMGCYGIGISRLMGVIAEKCNDDKGLIWPQSIAPCTVHLVGLDLRDDHIKQQAEHVYEMLREKNIEVLFDDRTEVSAGVKFSDADLIGIPWRFVVSKRTAEQVEVKKRTEEKAVLQSLESAILALYAPTA